MISYLVRRFRWVAIGAGARWVTRRGIGRSVDRASASLEERLPTPVLKAANALPGDLVRVGGAATLAGRTARRSGAVVVNRISKNRVVQDRLARAKSSVMTQSEIIRRELMSDYARYADGDSAALEALLDLRDVHSEPIPEVPQPVAVGRFRFRRSPAEEEVGRVQRTYRKPVKPWDRNR